MKKIKIYLPIIIAILFIANTLSAQEPPCAYDPCPGAEWQFMQAVEVDAPQNCQNCQIFVDYWYRYQDCYIPYTNEIQIGTISFSSDCINCFNKVEDIFLYVYEWVLKNNPLVPDDVDECFDNFVVKQVSCWHCIYTVPTDPRPWKWEWCNTDDCCWFNYEVCKTQNGYTVTYIESSTLYADCPEENGHICTYMCELIYDYFNPPIFGTEVNELRNNKVKGCYVQPNPTSGKIEIHFISDENDKYTFKLFDLNGNVLLNSEEIKSSNELIKNIDMTRYSDGIYFYKFIKNNKVVSGGRFTLHK